MNFWNIRVPIAGNKDRFKAFTLVEVALALGVVSFALLAMLGTVPLALSNFRSSNNRAVAESLLADVSTRAHRLAFSDPATLILPQGGFFTLDGIEQIAANADTIFRVSVAEVSPAFPGTNNLPSTAVTEVRAIEITVALQPSGAAAPVQEFRRTVIKARQDAM